MRYSIFALGAGNMAMAMFTNSTDGQATDAAIVNAMPAIVGDYELVGCAPNAGLASFVKVASTDDMDLDFCGASCQSKFMAVGGKDCFCGDEADEAAEKLDAKMCNSPCPGNKAQSCGASAGNQRRQAVPMTNALSMYMRAKAADPAGVVTKTVTSTKIATITSCAPTVTDCPVGKHVVTKVTEVCPRPTEAIEWHKKKIVCYGSHCAPEIPCDEGDRHRVICEGEHCRTEVCTTEEWSRLVFCKGDDCHWSRCEGDHCFNKKVVCFDGKCSWEKCFGDECHKKFVCRGDECKHEKCFGDDCHKKIICDPKGENCKPAPPPCHGKDCPKPPPPCHGEDCPKPCFGKDCPRPCHGENCPPPCHGENCPPPCHGENCPKPPPPCHGKDCPKPPPPPPCHGENCPPPPPCKGEHCRFIECNGPECPKPFRPTGSVYPKPMPTNPPIVAGAGNIVANVLGAAAGLLFVL